MTLELAPEKITFIYSPDKYKFEIHHAMLICENVAKKFSSKQ